MMACWRCCSRIFDCWSETFFRKPYRKAKSIWDDPILRKIVIIYLVTFFVVLPLLCYKLPHSSYSMHTESAKNDLRSKIQTDNDYRKRQAFNYFDMLNRTGLHSALNKQTGPLDIFISIVTVSRNRHRFDTYEPKYLSQVAWKLLELYYRELSQGMERNIKMAVCNVDMNPIGYLEATYLENFIPVISRYDKLTLSMVHPLEKEKQDYVFCLNASALYRPKYVLLIEDDALPHDDFFQVLDHMLQTKVEHNHDHYNGLFAVNTDVTYIKLYHPERLLGYINFEPDRLPELLGIALFFGTIFYNLFSCVYLNQTSKTYVNLWVLFGVYAAFVAITIGRSHLVELRRTFSPHFYTYVKSPECCTPAMVFPYDGAIQVINYLNDTSCGRNYGKDMALERMKRDLKISSFMIQPNLVTHIGLYSSLRDKVLDPFVV